MKINQLNQEAIRRGFTGANEELNIELLETVTSTNDVAKKSLTKHPNQLTIVASNKQTAGRGRSGKSFYSELDHGLYFTLAFQPKNQQIEDIPLYTILAATVLVEVLEKYVDESLAIKWVNDIFYQGRKISGILSEMVTNPATLSSPGVVVGIGVNFAGDFSKTENEVQSVAGTLFGKDVPTFFNQNDFLSDYLNQFLTYHRQFEKKAFMPFYEEHLLGIGQEVYYSVNEEKRHGVIQGINEQGHLLVRKQDQSIETLYGQAVHFSSAQFIEKQ